MLNNIRKALATFIAPSSINVAATQAELGAAKSLTTRVLPKNHHLLSQGERSVTNGLVAGKFHVSNLDQLSSDYLRSSIAQHAAWICLAQAYGEYERVVNKKSRDDKRLNTILDEFHCWNAALPLTKQYDDVNLVDTVARMSQVPPQKGNDATDAIIARVRGCSVDELRKARQAEADKKTKQREDMLEGFLSAIWSFTSSELDPFISGAKAEAKAISTIEFVANSWTGDPAAIAAEITLMEDDIKKIRWIAHQETIREGEGQTTTVGHTGQREYKYDPAAEMSNAARLDTLAYQEWLATQQAEKA